MNNRAPAGLAPGPHNDTAEAVPLDKLFWTAPVSEGIIIGSLKAGTGGAGGASTAKGLPGGRGGGGGKLNLDPDARARIGSAMAGAGGPGGKAEKGGQAGDGGDAGIGGKETLLPRTRKPGKKDATIKDYSSYLRPELLQKLHTKGYDIVGALSVATVNDLEALGFSQGEINTLKFLVSQVWSFPNDP